MAKTKMIQFMVSAAVLQPQDAVALREYVISIANEAKAKLPPPPPASAPKQAHE